MSCQHTSRCSGHCCKRFYLPLTPEELKYEATREDRFTNIRFNPAEMEKIHAMVIPLKPASEYEFGVNGVSPPPQTGYYYTCKYHNAETGDCNNYADRPPMCSDFPFYKDPSRRCEYQECTWEDARNPTLPVNKSLLLRKLPARKYTAQDDCTKEAA